MEVKHPRFEKIKIPGITPKFSETPGTIRQLAPELGEHTEEILKQLLHFDDESITQLKERGVI